MYCYRRVGIRSNTKAMAYSYPGTVRSTTTGVACCGSHEYYTFDIRFYLGRPGQKPGQTHVETPGMIWKAFGPRQIPSASFLKKLL